MTHRYLHILFAILISLGAAHNGYAQTYGIDNRQYNTREIGIEYGNISLKDTYLSKLEYFGWNTALNLKYSGMFQYQRPTGVYWKNHNRLCFGSLVNTPATASALYLGLNIGLGAGYQYTVIDNLALRGGLMFKINIAGKYNTRNVNNIASIDLSIDNWLDLEASYKIPFRNFSLTLRDNIQTPLIGNMFIPEYGALYYEYAISEVKNSIIATSPLNKTGLINNFAIGIAFKNIILQAYHRIDYQLWHSNNLFFRQLQNNFGLNMIVHFVLLPTK